MLTAITSILCFVLCPCKAFCDYCLYLYKFYFTFIMQSQLSIYTLQIHTLIHRVYLSPRRLYLKRVISSPDCSVCSLDKNGSYIYIVWQYFYGVVRWYNLYPGFWRKLFLVVSQFCCYVNNVSSLNLSITEKRIFLRGIILASLGLGLLISVCMCLLSTFNNRQTNKELSSSLTEHH